MESIGIDEITGHYRCLDQEVLLQLGAIDTSFIRSNFMRSIPMFVVKTALNRLSLFLVIASASLSCIWTDASAQSRPALVRDTDNAALAPFKSHTHISATYSVSLNAVPAGKRLVIQNVSYSGTTIGTTIVSADLYNSADGDIRLELGVPIPIAAGNGASYYNYTTPATAYFEAGEVPVVAFGTLNGTAVYFDVVVTGYYVTP